MKDDPRQSETTGLRLGDYLDGMRAAQTADELEAAFQAPFKHPFRGRVWEMISKVRREAGNRIVAAHPHAFYIPRHAGPRRLLTCCGQTHRVGYGQNSTGERHAWHAAGVWAQGILRQNGFGIRAAHRMWGSSWFQYPHRSIALAQQILDGKVPDPKLNVLTNRHKSVGPIKCSVEENIADDDPRATRPCGCGGTRFDWGGGHSEGFEFITWHCNGCPCVYTEYMTRERFYELRQRKAA